MSKWETDASVPDLDKLVKLCDLFGVSMDELVRREVHETRILPESQVIVREVKVGTPVSAVVGAVLLVVGVLIGLLIALASGGLLEALLLGLPVVLCGVICLTVKKHPGLWCAWLLVVLACVYAPIMLGTGLYAFAILSIAIVATVAVLRKDRKE